MREASWVNWEKESTRNLRNQMNKEEWGTVMLIILCRKVIIRYDIIIERTTDSNCITIRIMLSELLVLISFSENVTSNNIDNNNNNNSYNNRKWMYESDLFGQQLYLKELSILLPIVLYKCRRILNLKVQNNNTWSYSCLLLVISIAYSYPFVLSFL